MPQADDPNRMPRVSPGLPADPPVRMLGPLLTLGLLLVAVKLAVLLMPPLELSPMHVAGTVPGLPGYEEWRRGMAAEELLLGPLLPVLDLQQGHFQGGTLVTIGLDALSFAALGPSPFAMRLPNLLFDLAALVAVVLLATRLGGRRAGWLAGIFTVAAAPGYWLVGACAWASHVESNAQALVLLYLWSRHVFWGKRGARPAFVLGALAGLAVWYHYGVLLWLAVMLLVEVLHAPRRLASRDMAWRAAGALVGLVPWFIYNSRNGWAGLGLYGRSAVEHVQTDLAGARAAFVELWTGFLPGSLWIPDAFGVAGSGRVLELVLLAAAVVLWAALAWRALARLARRRGASPELALALYPPLWCAAYTVGSFHGDDAWVQGYRYMMSVHPVAWLAGALGLARLGPRGWRVASRAVAAVAVVLLASLAGLLRPAHLDASLTAPGRNLESLGRFLYERRLDSPDVLAEAARRLVERRSPVEADVVLFTLGNTLAYQADVALPLAPPDLDPELRAEEERRAAQAVAARERVAAVVPEAYRPYFAPLEPGERPWPWRERDAFWAQWDRRGEGRPAGAFAR